MLPGTCDVPSPLPLSSSFKCFSMTYKSTGDQSFIHGVTFRLRPAGRRCLSRQRRRLVSAGASSICDLVYRTAVYVPGVCGTVAPGVHPGWSAHKWHKIVLMELLLLFSSTSDQWKIQCMTSRRGFTISTYFSVCASRSVCKQNMYVCMYVCMHVCMYMYLFMCVYVFMYVRTYVCM